MSTEADGRNKQAQKKNVTLILLVVLIVQINVKNCDNRPHGGYPFPSGSGWYVSEEIEVIFFVLCFLFFDSESTKKKCFEKKINVCKWVKSLHR